MSSSVTVNGVCVTNPSDLFGIFDTPAGSYCYHY